MRNSLRCKRSLEELRDPQHLHTCETGANLWGRNEVSRSISIRWLFGGSDTIFQPFSLVPYGRHFCLEPSLVEKLDSMNKKGPKTLSKTITSPTNDTMRRST